MKYIVGLILIGLGIYLFYSIRGGGLPDIEDVEDEESQAGIEKT